MRTYVVGDVVVHIFGGPEMLVTSIEAGVAKGEWFNNGCMMARNFPVGELINVSHVEAPRKRFATPRSSIKVA